MEVVKRRAQLLSEGGRFSRASQLERRTPTAPSPKLPVMARSTLPSHKLADCTLSRQLFSV
jgi:hypothetical protein